MRGTTIAALTAALMLPHMVADRPLSHHRADETAAKKATKNRKKIKAARKQRTRA